MSINGHQGRLGDSRHHERNVFYAWRHAARRGAATRTLLAASCASRARRRKDRRTLEPGGPIKSFATAPSRSRYRPCQPKPNGLSTAKQTRRLTRRHVLYHTTVDHQKYVPGSNLIEPDTLGNQFLARLFSSEQTPKQKCVALNVSRRTVLLLYAEPPSGQKLTWYSSRRSRFILVASINPTPTSCASSGVNDHVAVPKPAWLPDYAHLIFRRKALTRAGILLFMRKATRSKGRAHMITP